MEEIKKNIRKAGFTQIQIAKVLGMKYSTLASYLNGYNPAPDGLEDEINKIINEDNK